MNREVYRYHFPHGTSIEAVQESLLLAVLAVECLRGDSVVRLDAAYYFDEEKRACVIDATTDVGRDISRIFAGFLTKEFGEDGFSVRKVTQAGVGPSPAEGRN